MSKLHHRFAAVVLLVGLLASACSSGGGGASASSDSTSSASGNGTRGTAASDTSGDWTVLAYVNGDNNLEDAALADLVQMTKAKGTTFIALVDRSPEYADGDLLDQGDFSDTRLLRIKDGDVKLLDKPGELNMGDPATLRTFVSSGLKRSESEHNALVIWDHGGGWYGAAWDDSSDSDNLSLPEIAKGLSEGLTGADHKTLDLIGFDACLMSTYEVAAQLAPYANYLVASEEVEPGGGWNWSTLSTRGGATTKELAGRIIDGFTKESSDGGSDDTTLSLLDLTQLDGLTKAIEDLYKAMSKRQARNVPGRIGAGRTATISFGKDPNPKNDYFLVDMGDLAKQLGEVEGLGTAAQGLTKAIEKVVVTRKNGPIAASASGIAVYFPPTNTLRQAEYGKIPTSKPWNRFLNAYYKSVSEVPEDAMPQWTDKDRLLEEGDDIAEGTNGIKMSSTVTLDTGGNIAEALTQWGEVNIDNSNEVTYYGDSNAVVEGDKVTGSYDWKRLMIRDGNSTAATYSSLTFDPAGDLVKIIIPIVYVRGDEQADGTLQLGLRKGKIIAETFYVRTGAGIAAVPPQEGDQFMPILLFHDLGVDEQKWVPASDTLLSADRSVLDFSYARLPAARAILMSMVITDLNGNEDYLFYGTATP